MERNHCQLSHPQSSGIRLTSDPVLILTMSRSPWLCTCNQPQHSLNRSRPSTGIQYSKIYPISPTQQVSEEYTFGIFWVRAPRRAVLTTPVVSQQSLERHHTTQKRKNDSNDASILPCYYRLRNNTGKYFFFDDIEVYSIIRFLNTRIANT